jgi:hypothetical protein
MWDMQLTFLYFPVYWSKQHILLHILNNDHTLGITDKKNKTLLYKQTHKDRQLEKLYTYVVKVTSWHRRQDTNLLLNPA